MTQPQRPPRPPRSPGPAARSPADAPDIDGAGGWPLSADDLKGLARLGIDATIGVTDLVEQMHHTIVARAPPLGRPRPGRTRGLTGVVYASVRGVTRLCGRGLEAAAGAVAALAPPAAESPRRQAWLAALQGVWGDHLEASGNPLATPMSLRAHGHALVLTGQGLRDALPRATGRIVVLVHGLCMNDLHWSRGGHHHGRMLAHSAGCTPVAVRYNSGLHVSDNGRRLSALLERLVAAWPVPVDELLLIGHSMGGLVARSACHAGADSRWRRSLTRLAFLGTPHHGARLERVGHVVDRALGLSPYTSPFVRIGGTRSAGITDLRHGNLQDADWQGGAARGRKGDTRVPTPLPDGVAVYCLAATTAAQARGARHALFGDGLVTVASAWGEHPEPARTLALPASHKVLITQADHWDLLSDPRAAAALRRWMG